MPRISAPTSWITWIMPRLIDPSAKLYLIRSSSTASETTSGIHAMPCHAMPCHAIERLVSLSSSSLFFDSGPKFFFGVPLDRLIEPETSWSFCSTRTRDPEPGWPPLPLRRRRRKRARRISRLRSRRKGFRTFWISVPSFRRKYFN